MGINIILILSSNEPCLRRRYDQEEPVKLGDSKDAPAVQCSSAFLRRCEFIYHQKRTL